ncbi:MAG: S24 family peptidase [Verrucomicrobiota bacterium]
MPRPRSTQLSPIHRRIAKAIAVIERDGFPALVSALVRELGLSGSSSLVPTLRIMERNRFVSIGGGGGFGRDQLVKLTPKGRYAIAEGGLPVLGSIQAGLLAEAVAEPETILEDHELIPYRPGDFLLRVRGDSMIGEGILPGDHVLLRPNVQVAQGEIAAVMVGGENGGCEATLKRFYLEGAQGRTVRLKAANPAYADLVVPAEEVKIAGVFRGLIRYADRRA